MNDLQPGAFRDYANAVLPQHDDLRTCDNCDQHCESTNKATTEAGDLICESCCLCVQKGCPWNIEWELCEECQKRMVA